MSIIRIASFPFYIRDPYSVGHLCTAAEAQALNASRAEQVRRSLVKLYDRGIAEGHDMTGFADTVRSYDALFTFSLAPVGDGISSLAREVHAVAMERAEEIIRMDYPPMSDTDFQSAATRLAASLTDDEWVQDEAKHRLEVRDRAAREMIADLLS